MYKFAIACLFCALLAVSATAQTILYSETFDADPGWSQSWTPAGDEFAQWNGNAYEVRVQDGEGINKFAFTPIPAVGTGDWSLAFDFQYNEISWGQPITVAVGDSSMDWAQNGLTLHWDDSYPDTDYLRLSASGGLTYGGPDPELGVWYSFTISFDIQGGTASWQLLDRESGTILWDGVDQPLATPVVDIMGIGSRVVNGEGQYAGMMIDNIVITEDSVGGLLSYHSFDDGTADDQAGDHDGVLMGAASIVPWDGTELTLDLSGGEGYVDITENVGDLAFTNQPVTVSCWVQITDNINEYRPFVTIGKSTTYSNQCHIALQKIRGEHLDGRLGFHVARNGNLNASQLSDLTGSELEQGAWLHLVGVVDQDNGVVRLYVNGVEQTYVSSVVDNEIDFSWDTAAGTHDPFTVQLGTYTGTQHHNSLLDEVRIYDAALTETEIQAIFEEELPDHQAQLEPQLTAVADVPDDQGLQVYLEVLASSEDAPGSTTPVLQYEVYRARQDEGGEGRQGSIDPELDAPLSVCSFPDGVWDYVGVMPAHGEVWYHTVAPTLVDGVETRFLVRAATADPYVYFDSEPTVGISMDNIVPGATPDFMVNYTSGGNQLSWAENDAPDLAYYMVYRGDTPDFDLTDGELIAQVQAQSLVDSDLDGSAWSYHYKLVAVDDARNSGVAVMPLTPSGTQNLPAPSALLGNFPNPFNPATTIVYSLSRPQPVHVVVYDLTGRRVCTLVAGEVQNAGRHEAEWRGMDDTGRPVPSGTYLYRVRAGEWSQSNSMVLVK